MELEIGYYVGRALQVLLLALTILGLIRNFFFLILMVVVFSMYREAMGYPVLFENASRGHIAGRKKGMHTKM